MSCNHERKWQLVLDLDTGLFCNTVVLLFYFIIGVHIFKPVRCGSFIYWLRFWRMCMSWSLYCLIIYVIKYNDNWYVEQMVHKDMHFSESEIICYR